MDEVRLGITAAETRQRLPLGELVLAAVLGQLDRTELLAERRVEAAGADRWQLERVTDKDRFPLGTLDLTEQGCEHARLGHPGLIDDQHTPGRQATVAGSVEQELVQGAARDPGRRLELVGGSAARRRTDHVHAACAVDLVERSQSGRLAGAGDADHTDDAVAAERRLANQPLLLTREVAAKEASEHGSAVRGRRADIAARTREGERLPFDLEQLPGREPCRSARDVARVDLLDAGEVSELVGGREYLPDLGTVLQRAGDGANELRLRERRLGRGQPIRCKQNAGEFRPVWNRRLEPGLVDEPAELAAPEAVLGGAGEPLLAELR
jgi:hypothetical protein